MGSVMSNIDCPNCNSPECFEDYYYKTGEGFQQCPDCGYSHSAWIINRDKLKSGEDKEPKWEEKKTENPYCGYQLYYKEKEGGMHGTFLTEEDFLNAKESITKEEDKISHFSISRFVNGKIEKQIIFQSKGLIKEIQNNGK